MQQSLLQKLSIIDLFPNSKFSSKPNVCGYIHHNLGTSFHFYNFKNFSVVEVNKDPNTRISFQFQA